MSLAVITCTGGRPASFALCERWMARQTYRGQLQWIVADDCEPPTCQNLSQIVVRPEPYWSPGQNTLGRNIQAGIASMIGINKGLPDILKFDKIVFVEDDDWYAPGYLQAMSDVLDRAPLAGEVPARYYNILTRQHWTGTMNPQHASLCQTAMRAELIPALADWCEQRCTQIDINFWRESTAKKVWVRNAGCVGIKGLPGRPGIGMGHRPPASWPHDPDGSVLRSWIGEDAAVYEGYAERAAA